MKNETAAKNDDASFDIFEHPRMVEELAQRNIRKELDEDRAKGRTVTFQDGSEVIRLHSDGRREVLETLED